MMTAINFYNSLFHAQAAGGGGQAAAPVADADAFIAQMQQAAIDDAAPAAKIKATATSGAIGMSASTPYTALPVAALARPSEKTPATDASGIARQLAAFTPCTGVTSFHVQSLAQQVTAGDSSTTTTTPATATNGQTAVDSFMQFAKQSPVERLRSQILGSMGLSANQVAQASPAQQEKIEAAVREKIREAAKKDLGVAASSTTQSAGAADILATL